MAQHLTKRVVEAVAPGERDVTIWDDDLKGFGLKVTPRGRRVYFVYYRTANGQQRKPAIGEHGKVTAEQARQIARQWLAEAALGGDVSGTRQAARKTATVADLAERYLTDYAMAHKKPRSIATDRANITNHVLPLIGSLKIPDVTRADVDRLKLAIRDGKTARELPAKARGRRIIRGGEGIANRVIALVSKMFSCAEGWGLREGNPVRGAQKFREKRKDRFLNEAEIGRLLVALDAADRKRTELPTATVAIRLLLLTGMRVGEVTGLRWKDIDRERNCLVLADTKTGARVIPLSSQAMAAIQPLSPAGPEDLVFVGSKADAPIALTRPWYRLRFAAGIDQTANLHSLRHTFASWSVMGGLSLAQVGAVLGHKSAQTTLRYADHRMEAVRAYSEQTGKALSGMGPRKAGE